MPTSIPHQTQSIIYTEFHSENSNKTKNFIHLSEPKQKQHNFTCLNHIYTTCCHQRRGKPLIVQIKYSLVDTIWTFYYMEIYGLTLICSFICGGYSKCALKGGWVNQYSVTVFTTSYEIVYILSTKNVYHYIVHYPQGVSER